MSQGTADKAQGATGTAAAPAPSAIESRVRDLRELAARDPDGARDAAWAWFQDLGAGAARDRKGATARLDELFRLGVPPREIDGQTEGIFVAPLIAKQVDPVARALTKVWMPWLGKSFNAREARGHNVLAGSARLPSKLLWPGYSMRRAGNALAAFDFETGVEPGKADPDVDVLKIDYAAVAANPGLVIRPIRDELVEIVPGANLGKILWRRRGSYALIGFFALKS